MGDFFCSIVPVKVCLCEDYRGRDAVETACDEQPVEERQLKLREVERDCDEGHIYVRRDDVRLPRQVGRAPDYVVAPRQHLGNDSGTCSSVSPILRHAESGISSVADPVADGYGIGGALDGKAQAAADHRGERRPLRQRGEQIPASRIFHYCRYSFHLVCKINQ